MVEAERGGIEMPTHSTALPIVDPVDIHVDRLSVHVNSITGGWLAPIQFRKQKLGGTHSGMQNQILHDVSVTFPSGSLVAILGPSGSGKTTLLNALCNQLSARGITVTGDIFYTCSRDIHSIGSAYLRQNDFLIPSLTVRETLQTAADLRMPSNDTAYRSHPTTGLDAANAHHIVQLLKDLAGEGRTVVVAIHTPRPEIWELFDHVLLLSQGHVLYNGPSSSVRDYFEQFGHSIPAWRNPAEILIDLVSMEAEADALAMVSAARINNLKERWKAAQCTIVDSCRVYPCGSSVVRHASSTSRHPVVPLSRQLDVLTRRTIRTTLRGPMNLFGSLSITIVLGIVTGAAFYQVDSSAQGLWSRQGALFSLLNIYGYPLLIYEIFRLSYDIRMFDREQEEGDIPGPAISFIVFYFLVGLWRSVAEAFLFLLILVLATYISLTAAVLAIAISRDFAIAGLIGNLLYTLQSLSGGYLVHVEQIPIWLRWSKWIAHNFYLYSALCAIEFVGPEQTPRGHLYSCSTIANSSTGGCTESYGKDVMAGLGFPRDWIWQPIVASFGFLIFYTLVAALLLQRPQMGATMTPDPQPSRRPGIIESTELQPLTPTPRAPGVDIQLNRFALTLTRRNLKALWSPSHELPILKPINTTFRQGELSVIMGPSGSGKTTIIHALTARLPRRYRRQGQVLYNSHYLPPSTIRTMCSYVSQFDYLQSFLTVRETLLFAAELRLPGWMTKEQKYCKVDSIIHTMGLASCAGTVVGDDKQKGISGGEKRRVSIGIQLLTDPRVLILDEPTSGLDAHTAGCILKKLKDLSEEGRTVICSIHQPRSDTFPFFSNILLLASDGSPVFAGPGEDILHYFRSHGFECPSPMNPCDFIIDLVTVDHRDQGEISSRTRVQQLIEKHTVAQANIQVTYPVPITSQERKEMTKDINSFSILLPLAIRRSALGLIRRPFHLLSRLVQAPGMAAIFIMFTSPLSNDSNSVQTRIGLLQQLLTLLVAGLLQSIIVYPGERDTFKSERNDGCMTAICFLVQYTCLELPTEIFSALISSAIFTFGPPTQSTFMMFLISSFNIFAIINCGESIGIILLSLFDNIGISTTLTPIVLYINWVFAGLLSTSLPRVFQIVAYILPSKYVMANIMPYAMHGLEFTCNEQHQPSKQCTIQNGKDVLNFYNFDKNPRLNILALAVCMIGTLRSGRLLSKPNSVAATLSWCSLHTPWVFLHCKGLYIPPLPSKIP
ncbi:P-loop containing nucleoside triphosphate hydrolase protein [Aspergillus pseudonomiae]|uniref:P-loop containing nucleoside triphosphate hydrolase protein n=1 Tax=Aspergillus pseudonomiae TaxID=1506151 RepID=A0A5N7DFK4_9EURO|nr:P-loop containing nucleoside triphosphate hydrolase protein [Aspergillus pseudonomiae]KAE8405044.1 P-loop containing nucleoside triphosphate hydrolase protein [Aspergillus pseudonomiae]